MGTVVSFDLRCRDGATAARALHEACAVLHHDDGVFSTWQPDSPLSRLRRGEISLEEAPPEITEVLAACRRAAVVSSGWFDPWRMPGGVDPTGLVKGWSAERAARALRAAGVAAAMVNAGGDIVVFGRPEADRPWRVGVRHPRDARRFTCVAELDGAFPALATSGTYERGHHVLDPFTGRPADGLVSATVTGPDLAMADALATGALAAGPPGLELVEAEAGYEAWLVTADGGTRATTGFPGAPPS